MVVAPSQADPRDERVPARRHARRRLTRTAVGLALGVAWLALGVAAVIYVGGALVSSVARGLALLPRALVWLIVTMQEGADWWSIAGRVGTAIGEILTTSQVAITIIALEIVGAAALYGLQRLVRNGERGASLEEEKQ